MYVIIEMQKTGDSVAIVPPVSKTDWFEAQSAYHQALSYAAISTCSRHTVILTDDEGTIHDKKCFYHGPQPDDESVE